MSHYQHILLATDLSKGSPKIAQRAEQLAKSAKAKLSVIHVLEHAPVVYGGGEFSIPLDVNLEENLRNYAEKALTKLVNKLTIKVDNVFIEKGSAKQVVTKKAHDIKADLIVVGSHGQHGITRFLGSTANGILHEASCDVLAVRC